MEIEQSQYIFKCKRWDAQMVGNKITPQEKSNHEVVRVAD